MSKNIADEFKSCMHDTDMLTAKNLLYLLSMRQSSVWFTNDDELPADKQADFMQPEENLLTFEQVKELYPQFFE